MEQVDILVNARWIIPVQPRGVVLEDHSLAIRDGRIVDIVPQTEAAARFQAATQRDLPGHALIPGLVNAHTHVAMNLLRGLADDMPLMTWLNEHIWPVEHAHMGAEFVQDGAEAAVCEMLLGGTTCFNDMYFFPEVTARVAAAAGMRANVGLILIDFPSAYGSGPEEYLRKGLALHDEYRNHPLVTTAFAPHAPYTVSADNLRHIRMLSDELELPVHMHLHETAFEVEQHVEKTGKRPLADLDEMGLVSPGLLAVHMTQLEDSEIERLAATGAHVVHCPESNLKLASGFCPVARLQAAGVNVALGTDGAASNNDLDLFGEMHTAALLAKGVSGDAAAVPAETALEMATINGARALGLADTIGSLEAGKFADITAVDLGGVQAEPVYHPISQLVYTGSRERVTDVWVAGRHLVKDRELTTLSRDKVLANLRKWRGKILATN